MSSSPPASARPSAALVWAALLVVYVVWGSTYLGIRISVESMPPFISAAARFVAAGLVIGLALAARAGPAALRVSGRQLAAAGLAGLLLLTTGNGMVVFAESGPPGRAVPSGIAALLIATVPLIVVLLRVVTGDRPRLLSLAGVLVGFTGVAALILFGRAGGGPVPLVGGLIVVAGAISWATGSFLSGRLPMPDNPFVSSAYQMVIGGLALGLLGALTGEFGRFDPAAVTARSWWALLYLTLAGSLLAYTSYVWLLRHATISLVSTYAYVNPAVAVGLGALFVGERITAAVLISGAIIVLGVALVVSIERPRREADPS